MIFPEKNIITALVTGVGDTVGQGLIKALRRSEISCRLIGTDRDELSAGFEWVDRGFLLSHCARSETYLRELTAICLAEQVSLIFPGSEGELELLARHADELQSKTGAIVVASPPEILRVAMNKWETCLFLKRAGLNFPRFARLDASEELERLIDEVGFPLIAKPFRGTGARGITLLKSRRDLESLGGVVRETVVQEYLQPDDEEYSVEVYTQKDGREVGAISYRRKHLVAGDTYKAKISVNEAVEAEARAVVSALGALGPCNVQLRLTKRGPVTFEINPRFSGGVAMRAHFGYNEPEMALRDLVLNQPAPVPRIREGVVLRYWEELYVEEGATTKISLLPELEVATVSATSPVSSIGKEGTPANAHPAY